MWFKWLALKESVPKEIVLPSSAASVKPSPLSEATTPVCPVFRLIKLTRSARVVSDVTFAEIVTPFKKILDTAGDIPVTPVANPVPTNTLALALAVTPVKSLTRLIAAAVAIALDTLVADVVVSKVAVSSVLRAAPTAIPLIESVVANKAVGAGATPAEMAFGVR